MAECPRCARRGPRAPVARQSAWLWVWLAVLVGALITGPLLILHLREGEIVFVCNNGDEGGELYRVAPDGTGLHRLTNNVIDESVPCLSRNGRQLAFLSSRAGTAEVHVAGLALRDEHKVGDDGTYADPCWTPDGRAVLCTGASAPDTTDLYLLPAGKGNVQQLTQGANAAQPSISADGTHLAFHGPHGLAMLNLASGTTAVLTTEATDARPRFSPDGKRIAFIRTKAVYVMSPTGADVHALCDGAGEDIDDLAWSPVGDGLCYHTTQGKLYVAWLRDMKHVKMIATGRQPTWSW